MEALLRSYAAAMVSSYQHQQQQLRPLRHHRRFARSRRGSAAVRVGRRGFAIAAHGLRGDLLGEKNTFKLNLNEYLVTLNRPLGIRFAQLLSGQVFVDALVKEGNAYSCGLVIVGDVLKKVVLGNSIWGVEDFGRVMNSIRSRNGPVTLVLERSSFPTHIQSLILESKLETSYNSGSVATATWENSNLASPNSASMGSQQGRGNVGFVVFSWRFLLPRGLKRLAGFAEELTRIATQSEEEAAGLPLDAQRRRDSRGEYQVVTTFSDEEDYDGLEWCHGNFDLKEFQDAQSRAANDLTYSRKFGIQYTKLIEHVFAGSCVENGVEVQQLRDLGVTAILNLQSENEQTNWGVDRDAISKAAEDNGIVIARCPIRDVDTVDLRRKLPLAVGILYRMLRLGHRIYVMCTSGLDRAPACIVAFLHWMQDVPLQSALDFVTTLHPCGPDRPALAWATWDLIAMVEKGNHEGPPTHAVQFVWSHGCKEGEEVMLVGDFKGEWNEPIKAAQSSGQNFVVDLRLPQGKYHYKFIVGGHWRHSSSLPTERDSWGNVNNVIVVGGRASTKFDNPVSAKDPTAVRVIERLLTEEERFTLAVAARMVAFSVSPLTFTLK